MFSKSTRSVSEDGNWVDDSNRALTHTGVRWPVTELVHPTGLWQSVLASVAVCIYCLAYPHPGARVSTSAPATRTLNRGRFFPPTNYGPEQRGAYRPPIGTVSPRCIRQNRRPYSDDCHLLIMN